MFDLRIGIMTCEKRGSDYLERTLRSLLNFEPWWLTGTVHFDIFSGSRNDYYLDDVKSNYGNLFDIHIPSIDLSSLENSIWQMQVISEHTHMSLFLQDDVVFCRNFIPYVLLFAQRVPFDVVNFCSYYTDLMQETLDKGEFFFPTPYKGHFGNQCLLIRPRIIKHYLENMWLPELQYEMDGNKKLMLDPKNQNDLRFNNFLYDMAQTKVLIHAPNIAKHIGVKSTIHEEHAGASEGVSGHTQLEENERFFPGESFDLHDHIEKLWSWGRL